MPWLFLLGRIMLNRAVKTDRSIGIDLVEQRRLPMTGEHGDSFGIQKKDDGVISPSSFLNKQSNA
jgi:hypothetical protein